MVETGCFHGLEIVLCDPGVPMSFKGCPGNCEVLQLAKGILIDDIRVVGVLEHARGDPWLSIVRTMGR
jgi:hypothetical protein